MFWLASRPDEALFFSQAGGASRIEKAGVWWGSMKFNERLNYANFVDNREQIEMDWNKDWQDRKQELVIIGQHMKLDEIIEGLEECVLMDEEILLYKNGHRFNDPFPEG